MLALNFKPALLAVAVLSVSAYTGLASAHCISETITDTLTQHDLYSVHCNYNGTAAATKVVGLLAQVNNTSLAANQDTVRLEIAKPGYTPVLTSDAVTGAAIDPATCLGGAPSPAVTLLGGTGPSGSPVTDNRGDYNILVSKTGGIKSYDMIFHCVNAAGAEVIPAGVTHEVHSGSAAPELADNALYSPDIDITIDH